MVRRFKDALQWFSSLLDHFRDSAFHGRASVVQCFIGPLSWFSFSYVYFCGLVLYWATFIVQLFIVLLP